VNYIDRSALNCIELASLADVQGLRVAEARIGASRLPVMRVPGVVYHPDAEMQIIGEGMVPLECVQTHWGFNFRLGNLPERLDLSDVVDVDEDVCVLTNGWSSNFAHWISEEMTKVAVLESAGFQGAYVLDGAPMNDGVEATYLRESIVLMGVDESRLRERPWVPQRYRSAYFTSPIHLDVVSERRDVFLRVRDRMLANAGATDGPPRRVWMVRGKSVESGRTAIVNADEVDGVLSDFGIEKVDLASLPVDEQLRLVHDSQVLTGPHGAGFVHTLFQRPQSVVIECFTPGHLNPDMNGLSRLMRHRYHICVAVSAHGQYPWGMDLKVDIGQLRLALETLDWQWDAWGR
jgi:capsular polysaccharide biosynthesis protein